MAIIFKNGHSNKKMAIIFKNGHSNKKMAIIFNTKITLASLKEALCGFLKDPNLPSIEKDNEVLMHHEYQKCF